MIKYLGINISNKLEDLYENNYCKLEKKIRQDLRRWSLIQNGIYSRVEIIKMMVLPQLLFLFQALPITLPEVFFTSWNKMIANFVWNGKKHRLKYELLTQVKEKGGLGAPNLKKYYYATQILTIMKWMRPEPKEKLINIEKELTNGLPYFSTDTQKQHLKTFCIGNTIKNWKQMCKRLKVQRDYILLREMVHDSDFKPYRTDTILVLGKQGAETIYTIIQ